MKVVKYLARRRGDKGNVLYDIQRPPKEIKSWCDYEDIVKSFECCKLLDDQDYSFLV